MNNYMPEEYTPAGSLQGPLNWNGGDMATSPLQPATYYGTSISEHISRTPEGFLIAHDAVLCRTAERVSRTLRFILPLPHAVTPERSRFGTPRKGEEEWLVHNFLRA